MNAMALNFLISGSGPGVGKTMVGCALAFAFKVRSMRVGVMKPVQTGCRDNEGVLAPDDAASLLAAASSDLPLERACLYRYRSALAPAAAAEVDGLAPPSLGAIERAYREILARSDVMLVEDADGLAAPIDWTLNYADLARALGLEIIMVAANRAGFINSVVLTLDYAARRTVPVRGFILSALDREASSTVRRDADLLSQATGNACLGTVRFKEPLGLNIVERLL
jgi:dethiobiotin synthetase